MAKTRTLPLAKLDDVNPDMGDCTLVYVDWELPRSCPRNGDGLHCEYADAANPDRCIYCKQEFAL